ncbi:MarR family winged helix-turn-helix transcriptional regulator [Azospirillum canadense]|uniref:MarR family winged helix-turn-helix transcriptional regulator n=1 Tax=Azospirillum canadense TaxID=403962 RepID=UPI0022273CEB|nr:MarR family transcriptional regulator [Azospirillum canadense]MCW2239403.1 DNA-binding MarR family transcriptional regulator [Azospirillum canadense]
MDQPLAQRPGFLLRRLHQIHVAMFLEECAEFKITPVQYSVLTVLERQPELDQATLGVQVGIDRATMAGVIARLVQRGLLNRSPNPVDRRMKLVSLTADGRKLLRRMDKKAQRAHDRTIAPLSEERRAAFLRDLAYLVGANNGYGRTPLHLP